MKHSLPPIVDSGVLPLSHFPTRMQCFVFRNWGLIEPAVLAAVLGCGTETVRSLAAEMGLPANPEVDPAWLTKNDKSELVRNERSVRICFLSKIGVQSGDITPLYFFSTVSSHEFPCCIIEGKSIIVLL